MDLSHLNENQLKAVTTVDGPVLVIAGAGTGKTSVLTNRIAYLVSECGVPPDRILAFTFTNKAAEEMKTRIQKMVPKAHMEWIRTYHGTCLKILKEDIDKIGWSLDFSILDEEDQISLVKTIVKDYKLDTKIQAKKIVKCIGAIKLDDIDFAQHSFYDLAEMFELPSDKEARTVTQVFNVYKKRLKAANQLDFSDLINYVHELFAKNAEVRHKWSGRFDYVMIDEFQDTNKKQLDIIKWIVGDHHNVFAVGDPNQTIFTWRGAYPEIFDDFYELYKGTKIIKLDMNYRSAKNILSAANELISHNPTNFKNELIPMVPTDAEVRIFTGNYKEDEANFICATINDYVKKYGKKYSDILILYRANYCSRTIEEKLITNQIPYVIFGSVNFYARKEIKDLISYLKMLYRPDDLSAMRIINVPKRSIGLDTTEKISSWAAINSKTFIEALHEIEAVPELSNSTKEKIKHFLVELDELRNAIADKGWEQAIQVILDKTRYIEYLQTIESDIEERKENIEALISAIVDFKLSHPNSTPIDFINEINLYTSAEKTKVKDVDCVHVMTVHMAKGKEYNTVFVYNFNEGVLPSPNSIITPGGLDEERRIAYVAMTRAKENLFITCTKDLSMGYSKFRASSPSRFLKEIRTFKNVFRSFQKTSNKDLDWYDSKKINEKPSYYSQPHNYRENFTNTYQYKVGDVVVHTVFGSGIVTKIDGDMIDIIFKKPHGKKTLLSSHNSLKRVVS